MAHHEVYRSASPYFTLDETNRLADDLPAPGAGSLLSYTDATAFAPPLTNYFYVVVAVGIGGTRSPVAYRVGTFNFGLVRE